MNDNYVKHTHVALFSISRLRFEGEVCYLIAAKPGSRASRSTQLACSLHVTQPGPPLHAPAPRQGWADHQDQDALKSEYTHSTVTTTDKMSSIPTEAPEKKDTEKVLPGGKTIRNGIVYDADGKP
jgi:hypothetical protein